MNETIEKTCTICKTKYMPFKEDVKSYFRTEEVYDGLYDRRIRKVEKEVKTMFGLRSKKVERKISERNRVCIEKKFKVLYIICPLCGGKDILREEYQPKKDKIVSSVWREVKG